MAIRGQSKWFLGAVPAAGIAFGAAVVYQSGGGDTPVSIDAGQLAPPPDAGDFAEIDLSATWEMHVVVEGASGSPAANGADGVQLADFDGNGLLDIVSGYEQGLVATVSFNLGGDPVTWATVTLAAGCSPEDAVPADVDVDGRLDVVLACETGTNRVRVIYAPTAGETAAEKRTAMLTAANWTAVDITASQTASARYMRAAIVNIAGDSAMEIVVGGKESSTGAAQLGYFSSPTPRTGSSWTFTAITPVGWVTQMYVQDLDGDTDLDIVYTDYNPIDEPERDTSKRGLRWLENLGGGTSWAAHQISPIEGQHRWFSLADWDDDGDLDIMDCRSSPPSINSTTLYANGGNFDSFVATQMAMPSGVGSCIHPTMVDVDDDGALDIAWSFAQATALEGVAWAKRQGSAFAPDLAGGHIAGVLDVDSDTKFDNLEWYDVDSDGDLDAVTSEQHLPGGTGPGIGVVWFENPLGASAPVADAGPPDAAPIDASEGGGEAIACAALTSGSGTASTEAVTASVSPTADAVVYAAFISSLASEPDAPSGVTGNGLTWAQEETVGFHADDRRITVFRAQGASPSAGAITATWAESQTSFQWIVVECTGVDTSGTSGSGATLQSTVNTASAATSIDGTLAALAAPTSVHLAFSGVSINGEQTADADHSELADTNIGTGASGLMAEWAIGETTATPTFASANAGIISIEVAAP